MHNYKSIVIAISACIIFVGCKESPQESKREIIDFNNNWLFAKDLPDQNYALPKANSSAFELVNLPHTAHIEPLIVNNQWMGTCWYRKNFTMELSDSNKFHELYFEGAMQNADVYLNGKHLMHHTGGYLPFSVPISNELKFGDLNILAVKLVNIDDSLVPPGKPLNELDFNRYGGIYRNVKLISTTKLHITDALSAKEPASGGVFVQFDSISKPLSKLRIKTQVTNQFTKDQTFQLIHYLTDASGRIVAKTKTKKQLMAPNQLLEILVNLELNDGNLWSPNNPYLYNLETQLVQNNKVIDNQMQKIGLRDVKLTHEGLFLNGKKIFLNGTDRHQEYPYIGYALSDEAQWREAVKIKKAGFDLVRLSHYPHSEAFMDACDALGLVTMNCIPGWQFNGNEEFKQHVLKDTRELIRRDRNRASVFFWELSLNESWMLPEFMDRILAVKYEELKDKHAISCAWIDYEGYDLFIPARQHGLPPYYWSEYKEGKRPVFVAEYGDWEYYAQNAGFNQTAYSDLQKEERTSRQLRGSGEKRLLQQALNYQEAFNSNLKGSSTIGHANWLMFDYNRGYANDLEASGISDIFRLPKFAYYFYQSQRDANEPSVKPADSGPMVFIASNWTPESSNNVKIYSNCDEVELFLNGSSLGKQQPDQDALSSHLKHPPFTFSLNEFIAGSLKAIGYINGKEAAIYNISSPQQPESIELSVDVSEIEINKSGDVLFVYAKVLDKNGMVCPTDESLINFDLTGNASLIGQNPVMTEAGIATILLKTNHATHDLELHAQTIGLKASTIQLHIKND